MKAKGFILLSAIIMITMCLTVTASAEIVGRPADGYSHSDTEDNGQEIYFASIAEETPVG